MKEIFPSKDKNNASMSPNQQAITNQQYEDLVRRTNEAVCCAAAACQCVSDFNSNPDLCKSGSVNASTVNTPTVNTTTVNASTVNAITNNVDCIKFDNGNYITEDNYKLPGIQGDSTSTNVSNLNACNVNVNNGHFNNCLSSTIITGDVIAASQCLAASHAQANEIHGNCATFTRGNFTNASVENATIDCATICELNTSNINIDNIEADSISVTCAEANYITHLSDPQYITQELADTGDYWILLPIFTNGNFFIQANNDGEKMLWSTEITNSLKNIQIRWSQDDYLYIKDFKIAEDARGASVLQIHANLNNETAKLYHQSISTSNTDQLAIYSTDQLPETEAFNVDKLTGTWIQDIIFTNTINVKNLEMDNVAVDCVTICKQLRLTCGYEEQGGVDVPVVTAGTCNQYVQNKEQGHGVVPTWVTPANIVQCCNEAFIMSCDIANYNGTAKSADAGTYTSYNVENAISSESWEYDSEAGYYINPHTNIYYSSDNQNYDNVIGAGYDAEEHAFYVNAENTHVAVDSLSTKFYEYHEGTNFYPVTQLGNETCVHGSAEIECNLSVGNNVTVEHSLTSCCFNDSDLNKHVTDGITNVKAPSMEYCFIQCSCGDGWYPGSCVWNRGFYGNTVKYTIKSPYTKVYACIEGTLHGPFDMLCTPYSTTDGKIVYCGYYNGQLTEEAFWCAPRVSSQYVWACWYCRDEAWTKQPEFLRAKDGKYNRLAVYSNASLTDKCPVIYDAVDDSIKTTDNLGVSCATIDSLTAGKAYICELHAVTEVQEQSTSDYLTLRTNNATSLTNEQHSGLLVNNYDGSHMAGVVVDCEGTLRVGDGTKDNDIYPSIYYNTVDGKWYKDEACTIEEEVIGTLTAWDSREEIDEVIHYTNAVFTTVIWQELSNTYYKAHQKDDPIGETIAYAPISQCRDCGQTMVSECVEFFINGIDRCEYTTSARIGYHPTAGQVIEVCGVWRAYALTQWCFHAADIPIIDTCNTLPVFDPSEVTVCACPLIISRYSNAVDSLEPLLTRDEAIDMNNQGLFYWDCTGNKAKTLPLPTCDEQTLTACVSSTTMPIVLLSGPNNTKICADNMQQFNGTATISPYGQQSAPGFLWSVKRSCITCPIPPEWNDCEYIYVAQMSHGHNLGEVKCYTYSYAGTAECPYLTNMSYCLSGIQVGDDSSAHYCDAFNQMSTYKEEIHYIAAYTTSGASTLEYCWKDKPAGNYTFASMACYEAYAATHNIPLNSTINIQDEETYLKVEEEF